MPRTERLTNQKLTVEIDAASRLVRDGLGRLKRLREEGYDITFALHTLYYKPHPKLKEVIAKYDIWCQTQPTTPSERKVHEAQGGRLMEQLALSAFMGLEGDYEYSSFTSVNTQHDLVIYGDIRTAWGVIQETIGFDSATPCHKVVIEAKNLKHEVDSAYFSRLCFAVQNKYAEQCRLGVFFTRKGAKGFNRRQTLTSARATQILFHASTQKYIVVFDESDIRALLEPGMLIKMLRDKISDIEDMRKTYINQYDGALEDHALPDHLAEVLVNDGDLFI